MTSSWNDVWVFESTRKRPKKKQQEQTHLGNPILISVSLIGAPIMKMCSKRSTNMRSKFMYRLTLKNWKWCWIHFSVIFVWRSQKVLYLICLFFYFNIILWSFFLNWKLHYPVLFNVHHTDYQIAWRWRVKCVSWQPCGILHGISWTYKRHFLSFETPSSYLLLWYQLL